MGASEKEVKRRLDIIRERMKEKHLEALVIFSQVQTGYAGAVRYISNYHLTTRKEYLALPLMGDPVLILPTLGHQFYAKSHSWIRDVRSGGETEAMIREIASVMKMFKVENQVIGIVGLNTMPFHDHQLLTKELPNAQFKDVTKLLDEIRMVKSPEEIDMIQQTTDIADSCYARLLEVIRIGMDEREVLAEVYKGLAEGGVEDILILTARGPSFPGFIDHPGPYIFREGDGYIFSIEISGPTGYWTQIVRPLCLGKSSSRYEHMFEVGKAAVEAGMASLIPGKRIGELVKAVVGKVKEEGFKTGLWCGHGMGLDVSESPGLFQDSMVELKEGMIITLHPHVLSQDGNEGIFLGDTFVVQKEGPRNLSRTTCNLEALG